ncbi:cupin domain-containing protein [bacterium]|nr:cupin domain-containing protein [bacterium]
MSFIKIDDVQEREVVPGFIGRFIHSDNMTIAYWNMKAGAVIPLHEHIHEMIVNVIRGQLQLTVGNETRVLEPGIIAIIPSHVPHTATAITECFVIDCFYPVREDYK